MMPFSVACEELGLSSQLPGSMQAALYALACFPSYKTAVRANIVAGGDNALRAWLIASLLAAEQGTCHILHDAVLLRIGWHGIASTHAV